MIDRDGSASRDPATSLLSRVRAAWPPYLLVAGSLIFGLALLLPVAMGGPLRNDRVIHEAFAAYAASQWQHHWFVDHWHPNLTAGFAVFTHYPHLSHLVAAVLAHFSPVATDGARVYAILAYLLMAFMPLSVYLSMRVMGLSRWASSFGAALYPIVATEPKFGIGWESYVSHGLMSQLWATFFIFPALALGYRAIRSGGVYAAGLVLAACALSHPVYAYVGAFSLLALVALPDRTVRWNGRVLRYGLIGLMAAAASAYFVLPFVVHLDQVLLSQWEPTWKRDSVGLWGLGFLLLSGRMFDGDHLPTLSLAMAAGIVGTAVAAVRTRDRLRLWLLSCLLIWLVIFAGRNAWGGLIDMLPLAHGIPMRRFMGGVQVFALILGAAGLDTIRRAAVGRKSALWAWAFALAVLGTTAVPIVHRLAYARATRVLAEKRQTALERASDYRHMVSTLRRLPPGRVHAGMYDDWGERFRIADVPLYALLQSEELDVIGKPFQPLAITTEWQVRSDFGRLKNCDLYNIRYILAPAALPPPSFGTIRERRGRFVLYETPSTGYFATGRVEPLARDAVSTGSVGDAPWKEVYGIGAQWFSETELGDRRYLAMEHDVVPLEGETPEGRIENETVRPGHFGSVVEAKGVLDVVLKATYHPFWNCRVDGEVRPIVRVFPGFMAVRVNEGRHSIEFDYRPPTYKYWLFALSVVLLVGGCVGAVARSLRRSPRRQPESEGSSAGPSAPF